MKRYSAMILGPSGLIGSELLKLCLQSDDYSSVVVPVRRPLGFDHEKLCEKVIDFNMPPWEELFPVDHIYCCLGTTIKKAGSQSNFRKVDHDYPLAFAAAAKKFNALVFSIVTAAGSNAQSKIFYNRVKGEIEINLKALNLNSTLIFQPSLLLGDRKEFRIGEKIGIGIAKLTGRITPSAYRAIQSKAVANSMLNKTLESRIGFHLISNQTMHKMA